MFWADRIGKEIQDTRKPRDGTTFVIRDEKTLSGRVHIGSMRGVAIHGAIAEVLNEYGIPNKFLFEFNDFDPFDTVPGYLDQGKFKEHLGKPLYRVPSPEPGFENYAEYYGAEFAAVHAKAGFFPEYYRTYKDLYAAGKMDALIKTALKRAEDIRRILKEVSGSQKDESWLPVSVVCEKCEKIMTTRAHDYDGETVGYTCDRSPDDTVPCGHTGRVRPEGAAMKLFWKVDWAAKWVAMGVDIEGAGKDHSTKGGSRDVSKHISKEVFGYEEPFDIPYEFFLVGGKKMSSSKGRGSSAKEMSELFPTEALRLTLLGKEPMQQIDVDPSGDSVPRVYDWYDEIAEKVREGVADDFTRLHAFCQLPKDRAEGRAPWQLRFGQVAFMVQMPHLSLEDEAASAKGEPLTDEEKTMLKERADYARFWLATYAPLEYKYELQKNMPEIALTDVQKHALSLLKDFLAEKERTGEELHLRLHELKTEAPIAPKELFSAIYGLFLNRTSGPKAGWFLSVLPRDMVLTRLEEAMK
ncbi:MAG: lysine--tRNA ligase [Patescibacteria group bacterium]